MGRRYTGPPWSPRGTIPRGPIWATNYSGIRVNLLKITQAVKSLWAGLPMGKGPAATAGIERAQSSSRKAWPPGRMARRSAAYQLFLTRLREARIAAWLVQAGVTERLRRPQSYVSK